jgi:hypothetical protein
MTRTKTNEVPALLLNNIRLETRIRKPESRAYTVDLFIGDWISTSEVPAQFRALVDSALIDAGEAVLNNFVTSKATAGNMNIPASLFTLEALLQSSAAKRMTVALLVGMWKQSSKYVLDVAPKLTSLQGSPLLRYQAAIEKHEKRLAALAGRSPELTLSASDLDKIMVNLADDDADTSYGTYLADRTEEVRGKLVEDSEAL